MAGEWRKQIGPTLKYRGHNVEVRAMQPDVLAYVDGQALPSFYIDAESARKGGMNYIDELMKARKENAK